MERIFSELNREVVCRLSDNFPAEALVKTEKPKFPWQPFDEELAEKLLSYPRNLQSIYRRSVNEVLRGLQLSERIENMRPKWNTYTPLERLRQLDLKSCQSLPQVSKSSAKRALELVG